MTYKKKLRFKTLRGCQQTIFFLSLTHAQQKQNVITQNHYFYDFASS